MSHSPARAVRRFGFRQTIRSALILGVLVGLVMGAQGAAYAKAFPTEASRQKLVTTLDSLSGANFFAGEIANAGRPDSYAIYKSIAMTTLIIAVWGLLTTTRLLRGFEEDGRLEVLEAGALSKRRTSSQLLLGFAGSLAVSLAVSWLLIAALGADPQVKMATAASLYMTVASFLPGMFFAALGVTTAQLARTRGRAIVYALVPLIALYVIRGTANSVSSVNWLKHLTPFGWSDLLNPVLSPKPLWIVPTFVFAALFVLLGLYWAGRRDLGEALIRQSSTARSHFYLLGSPNGLAIRQQIGGFAWWTLGILAFSAFFAAVANASSNLANDSPALKSALSASSANDLKLTFLGVGTMFSATFLLIMATLGVSRIRRDEARGYLDNLLVQPTRRTNWLIGRLTLVAATFMAIALLASLTMWGVAHAEQIDVSLGSLVMGALSLGGVLALTLGIGALLYGILPRLAVATMAVVIGWAFVLDILKSFFHLSSFLTKTSVLTYIPTNPAHAPDWPAIAWLVIIGLALAAFGTLRFTKRDVVAE
jgi:ABC-2 type transport system permease protein